MRFTDLKSKQATLVETHIKQSSLLLENACIGLTKKQKQIVEGIHTEFKPLIEASLTVDQIQGLFGNIEQTATAGGDNRTLVGKGKDTVDKVNDIINKAGKWVQDTTPVKGFDNKFEQLKTSVGKKFPELDKQLTSMGTWAKENPAKTATIIGVLTALASLAGGPVGGAIAGQVLRGTTELMKGEKLSTAVGKGLKTATIGFLAGKAFEEIGDLFGEIKVGKIEGVQGWNNTQLSATRIGLPGPSYSFNVTGFPEDVKEFKDAISSMEQAVTAKDWTKVDYWHGVAQGVADKLADPAYVDKLSEVLKNNDELIAVATEQTEKLNDFINATKQGVEILAQGAATAVSANEPKQESYSLSETDLRRLWVGVSMMSETSQTNEGPLDIAKGAFNAGKNLVKNFKGGLSGDAARTAKGTYAPGASAAGVANKGGKAVASKVADVGDKAKQAAGAVASKVADVGKNLTTKVTASKLATAWEKAGKPTEDIAVHEFLVSQGVEASTVDNAFKSAKLKVPQVPNVKVAELTKLIKGLTQEQFAQLKQQIIDKYNKLQGQPA